MARPTKYKYKYCSQVYKLCLLRAIDEDIADFFDISVATLTTWKKKYPKFMSSIKRGKIQADSEVAEKLYQRACGYSHPEDKIFNDNGKPLIVPTIKHYPPDTAAAFIWLKNRAGWKDKTETEHSLTKETATLMGLIDGSSKGVLPAAEEAKE